MLVVGSSHFLRAQTRKPFYSREISLTADNDYLCLQDYYYTAGQDIIYRRLLSPDSRAYRLLKPAGAEDSSKVIVAYRYGVMIFTPTDIDETDPKLFDRPYAGWNFGSVTASNFPSARKSNQYQMEMGIVGQASGMESLQNYVHRLTHYDPPKGWIYQIHNELVANFAYARFQNWKLTEDLDIVSQSSMQAGTGSNKLAQEVTLRMIQFNNMNNSVFSNSRLSWDTRQKGKGRREEVFFFASAGIQYVLSNIFIEGSLFSGNKTPYTAVRELWVFQSRYGVMYSQHNLSWSATYFHLSKEVVGGSTHDYVSLMMAVRF